MQWSDLRTISQFRPEQLRLRENLRSFGILDELEYPIPIDNRFHCERHGQFEFIQRSEPTEPTSQYSIERNEGRQRRASNYISMRASSPFPITNATRTVGQHNEALISLGRLHSSNTCPHCGSEGKQETYPLDHWIPELVLDVEQDGSIHATKGRMRKDEIRDAYLLQKIPHLKIFRVSSKWNTLKVAEAVYLMRSFKEGV